MKKENNHQQETTSSLIPSNNSEELRIAKFIAQRTEYSRRDAEALVQQGRVVVNGETLHELGHKVNPNQDQIMLDGVLLSSQKPRTKIWTFYKPQGLVTTHKDPQNRETVFDYLKSKGLNQAISIGRLDLNSEGLLILTNNSEFSHYAESPQTEWKRCYKVRVFGKNIPLDKLLNLKKGITIDSIHYKGIDVELLDHKSFDQSSNQWLLVTLVEGKNREIRNVMEYFGLRVNRLIRVSYGPFDLGDLRPGEIKKIDIKSIPEIQSIVF
ncbi:MAG: pseudouridine synthase [Candidatus Puniceispirillum sp.]|nr:pseudouridine synthase [Candidatus Pelagibacter sp.]MBA4283607.1 pseudouridine synthase [Candidatus Puniceispirillum sp.]